MLAGGEIQSIHYCMLSGSSKEGTLVEGREKLVFQIAMFIICEIILKGRILTQGNVQSLEREPASE